MIYIYIYRRLFYSFRQSLFFSKEIDNISGTIAIGQLFSDLSMNIIKSTDLTDYPGGKNCEFVTIHEIEPGTIFVGGVDACTEVCSWNYIDDPKPKCYSENEDIYNFISFCAI